MWFGRWEVKFQRALASLTAGGLFHLKAEATDYSETSVHVYQTRSTEQHEFHMSFCEAPCHIHSIHNNAHSKCIKSAAPETSRLNLGTVGSYQKLCQEMNQLKEEGRWESLKFWYTKKKVSYWRRRRWVKVKMEWNKRLKIDSINVKYE